MQKKSHQALLRVAMKQDLWKRAIKIAEERGVEEKWLDYLGLLVGEISRNDAKQVREIKKLIEEEKGKKIRNPVALDTAPTGLQETSPISKIVAVMPKSALSHNSSNASTSQRPRVEDLPSTSSSHSWQQKQLGKPNRLSSPKGIKRSSDRHNRNFQDFLQQHGKKKPPHSDNPPLFESSDADVVRPPKHKKKKRNRRS
uniref:Uncharacterized protein n=1 Tax=Ditylenchus dipsaci TaxID=166011 RepID=A0A915DCS7_9BILA